MGAEYGDLRGPLEKLIQLNKEISRHLKCIACSSGAEEPELKTHETISGTENDINEDDDSIVLSGLTSFSIVNTSTEESSVSIITSDNNSYTLEKEGEIFSQSASPGYVLPDIVISTSGGSFKYHGIK